ncbi:glutaconate CoA-transferase subunit A [Proteiniborus ethanoligenes]|uniref:Glutaconate CoA-transferase subunit A n=1 Tax=Proteiniborus ethanoligenes TaxID=415015 RepID=A0A1H3PUD0_9FIRM|nr:CoA-transferase [Proteiniborus ethanoligenes]SDZ04884.1 glutaconate CoA-transferase subunit A [Proteiniborus ethanoligenes]
MDKIRDINEVIEMMKSNDIIAFGGNVLHRSPIQVAYHIANSNIKDLHIVKTAMAMEIDILALSKSVKKVSAGFISYEGEFGLCNNYRKAVQDGEIQVQEHACYSVIAALRAAIYGIPFMPIRGLLGSDLVHTMDYKTVADPYTGEEIVAIQAIVPDWGIIHVQKADRFGNCEIIGPMYEDDIVCRAAKNTIITCEEIVGDEYFKDKKADISEVFVKYVVELPKGASPGYCPGYYGLDKEKINSFKNKGTLK